MQSLTAESMLLKSMRFCGKHSNAPFCECPVELRADSFVLWGYLHNFGEMAAGVPYVSEHFGALCVKIDSRIARDIIEASKRTALNHAYKEQGDNRAWLYIARLHAIENHDSYEKWGDKCFPEADKQKLSRIAHEESDRTFAKVSTVGTNMQYDLPVSLDVFSQVLAVMDDPLILLRVAKTCKLLRGQVIFHARRSLPKLAQRVLQLYVHEQKQVACFWYFLSQESQLPIQQKLAVLHQYASVISSVYSVINWNNLLTVDNKVLLKDGSYARFLLEHSTPRSPFYEDPYEDMREGGGVAVVQADSTKMIMFNLGAYRRQCITGSIKFSNAYWQYLTRHALSPVCHSELGLEKELIESMNDGDGMVSAYRSLQNMHALEEPEGDQDEGDNDRLGQLADMVPEDEIAIGIDWYTQPSIVVQQRHLGPDYQYRVNFADVMTLFAVSVANEPKSTVPDVIAKLKTKLCTKCLQVHEAMLEAKAKEKEKSRLLLKKLNERQQKIELGRIQARQSARWGLGMLSRFLPCFAPANRIVHTRIPRFMAQSVNMDAS